MDDKLMSFGRKIVDLLIPGKNEGPFKKYREFVIKRIVAHFDDEMENESTDGGLLFHTSFEVYVRPQFYSRISQSFPFTVRECVNKFQDKILAKKKKYPDYRPHTRYWEIQLVKWGNDLEIEGVSKEMLGDNPILVRSRLAPSDPNRNKKKGGGADESAVGEDSGFVGTMYSPKSVGGNPCDIDLSVLKGLTQLSNDKYWVKFNLDERVTDEPQSEAATGVPIDISAAPITKSVTPCSALVKILDGEFMINSRTYKVHKMQHSRLTVSGKNGPESPDNARINSDRLPSPAIEINYDATTGLFTLRAFCDVKLSQKKVPQGAVVNLPHNSRIMINGEYELEFTKN